MVSPAQLSYIFALLKHRNFQRAASSCFVTQPTLSMQLKKVEESIGYKLFDRDTSPISLTREGEQLLPILSVIQTSYDELNVEIQKLKGIYKAEIRIGIIPTISSYLVPELYSKWKDKMGDINLDIIELTSENLLDALKNKTIDFGVMAGPLNDLTLEQQILYNEEIFIYAPRIMKEMIDLEELENEQPWLLSPGNCLRTQMINFCQLDGSKSEWNYEGGSLQLLVKMVEQEGGYTLIPSYFLPILNIDKKHIKKITKQTPTPVRQIIGVSLKRNTKKEVISKIIRSIQGNKNNVSPKMNNIEVLPWKT